MAAASLSAVPMMSVNVDYVAAAIQQRLGEVNDAPLFSLCSTVVVM